MKLRPGFRQGHWTDLGARGVNKLLARTCDDMVEFNVFAATVLLHKFIDN